MKPTKVSDLKACFESMKQDTQELVQIVPEKSLFNIFIRHHWFAKFRRAKMLAFCDGWKAYGDTATKVTPVYRGMTVQTGVWYVMKQLSEDQIRLAGDPSFGILRGWQALEQSCDTRQLLPFTEEFNYAQNQVDFYAAISAEVSIVICNIWDVRNQLLKEGAETWFLRK